MKFRDLNTGCDSQHAWYTFEIITMISGVSAPLKKQNITKSHSIRVL